MHLGLTRAVKSILRENKRKGMTTKHIKLAVNVDGLPIYTSCKESLWLILVAELDSKEVYPVGIFYGRDKPHDANEFLKQFVDEATKLINDGRKDEDVAVSIEVLICDTPANAFVLYVFEGTHSSRYSRIWFYIFCTARLHAPNSFRCNETINITLATRTPKSKVIDKRSK